MATLVFSALGTVVGGPLGGAIGAMVGRQVDAGLLGGNRQGPRLKELSATTSSYGATIPRHFGRMRVAGTIIWATELSEHSETQGSKGGPSTTSYSYTASFAVALSSRLISGVGRIWADGNLLRGAAGDLKCAGVMRIYTGQHDQAPDPLIAAAEGLDRCPAYRGLAYIVFEDLALADFYNRLPALTFEVIADQDGVQLRDIVEGVIDDIEADIPLTSLEGFSAEGSVAETLQLLEPFYPLHCDASGDGIMLRSDQAPAAPVMMAQPAISVADDDFGAQSGYLRKRAPPAANPLRIVRYYDVERDFLPGVQRATGQAGPGQPQTAELPAAMTAMAARDLVETSARRIDWSRETLAWRTAELDPKVSPGAVVIVPGQTGRWLVDEWEWRDTGVEVSLSRMAPRPLDDRAIPALTDAGRINALQDLPVAPTLLSAFELPWDGTGSGDVPVVFAAVSSPQSNWKGAALFVDHGDGNLVPLNPSGRTRSVVGRVDGVLPPANPLIIDRASRIVVSLADPSMTLRNADGRQLVQGANRALLGDELIQFGQVTALGAGRWRLQTLMRGRGGSEALVYGHVDNERFVLLDGKPLSLDGASFGSSPRNAIVAVGLGDGDPVTSAIGMSGITRRPLTPVHGRATHQSDGSYQLSWTRRARGAWVWEDGLDVPVREEREAYLVTFGDPAAPLVTWNVFEPRLAIDPATLKQLSQQLARGQFAVRQLGSYARSEALLLTPLS